jgi:two-component system cell cycle sensor histidine kinase PleC
VAGERRKNRDRRVAKSKRELVERLRAQGTLNKPWEQLISIFDAIDEGVYVADPETYEILYANPAKKSLFGKDIVGKKCYAVFQDLDKPCDFCTNPLILGKNLGKTNVREFKNRKTGNWIRCIDRAICWSDNRIVRFELAIDIHDRMIAEEALRASEEKYRRLVENIHEVIYSTDTIGTVTYVSPAIEPLTGYSPAEIEGRHFSEFIFGDDVEYLVSRYGNALSGQATPAEYRLLTKSGGYRWVRTFTKPIRYGDEAIGLQGVLSDITNLKRSEEALKEREKELTSKTIHLEEMNAALRVLLEKRERDKEELEEQVLRNVKQLVAPYIEKLKKVADGRKQRTYLDVIEKNLGSITSAFSKDLNFRYQNLTPTEFQIAGLIREGKSTKEIAELMNLSDRTVESHRKNLRRKMGLKDRKVNLRTTLLTIK